MWLLCLKCQECSVESVPCWTKWYFKTFSTVYFTWQSLPRNQRGHHLFRTDDTHRVTERVRGEEAGRGSLHFTVGASLKHQILLNSHFLFHESREIKLLIQIGAAAHWKGATPELIWIYFFYYFISRNKAAKKNISMKQLTGEWFLCRTIILEAGDYDYIRKEHLNRRWSVGWQML